MKKLWQTHLDLNENLCLRNNIFWVTISIKSKRETLFQETIQTMKIDCIVGFYKLYNLFEQ